MNIYIDDDDLRDYVADNSTSVLHLSNALDEIGFQRLGWMNGWRGEEKRTLPWSEPFTVYDHVGCLSLCGDYARREFYLVDSGD